MLSLGGFAQNNTDKEGFVRVDGKRLLNPDGTNLLMQGINLGNWLNPEGYMFDLGDEADCYVRIDQAFREMVGDVATDHFWRDFQKNYITEEDIQYIRKTGMNIDDSYGYPWLMTEEENKVEFCRMWERLGLNPSKVSIFQPAVTDFQD